MLVKGILRRREEEQLNVFTHALRFKHAVIGTSLLTKERGIGLLPLLTERNVLACSIQTFECGSDVGVTLANQDESSGRIMELGIVTGNSI